MDSIFSFISSIYNWVYPVKKQEIDDYNTYISLITKCIGNNNKVILDKILESETCESYKMRLMESTHDKQFLLEYSMNPNVSKEISETISEILNNND